MSGATPKRNISNAYPFRPSRSRAENRLPHPFRKGERDNFPNLDDAFNDCTNTITAGNDHKKPKTSEVKSSKNYREPSESLLFAISPDKTRYRDVDPDQSTCSYSSSMYDDVSVNLSIGAKAALAEHRHYISNHGLDDDEFAVTHSNHMGNNQGNQNIPPEDIAWNKIMDGNSFREIPDDSLNQSAFFAQKLKYSNHTPGKNKNASIARSFCDTSDFFNTSRVNILFTPERNKPKVDAASRRALMGDGSVNKRGVDYEDDFDESQIDYSVSQSAQLDESYLVGMLNAAANINSSHSPLSRSHVNHWEDEENSILEQLDNRNDIMSPTSQVFNESFREKLNWDAEENEISILEGNFSEVGTSFIDKKDHSFAIGTGSEFLDNQESSFLVGGGSEFFDENENSLLDNSANDLISKKNSYGPMTPISKREGNSYFETPPVSSRKRQTLSQFNYLGISPMHEGLNSSVIESCESPKNLSPVAPFNAQESFIEEKDAIPTVFDDSSAISSITKKNSSSDRQKSKSSGSKSFSLNLKRSLSSSSSEQNNSLREFNPNNSRVVYFDHGVEVFDESSSSKSINESYPYKQKLRPDHNASKKHAIFTPDTEISQTPSYDCGRYKDSTINETASNNLSTSSRKNNSVGIQPVSLLKSFETNVRHQQMHPGYHPQHQHSRRSQYRRQEF